MATRLTAIGAGAWPARVAATVAVVLAASIVSVLVRPVTHAAESPLFVAAVIYAFIFIKRYFDRIDQSRH